MRVQQMDAAQIPEAQWRGHLVWIIFAQPGCFKLAAAHLMTIFLFQEGIAPAMSFCQIIMLIA
jgi:hypothetical protein